MITENSEYNLSFAGCGFLGFYHAGVSVCIQEFAPQLYKGRKVSGASVGALTAAFLVCEMNISDCVKNLMQAINSARSYWLGPFDPRFKMTQYLREALDQYLPEDAHIRCSGHLHISMTNQETFENYITKNYKDRNELIKAILCSSYIPIFSGFIPITFRGEWMIDGALTMNTLELDRDTITISPFTGDGDICPRDDWGYEQIYVAGTSFLLNPNNLQRMINIFWPKSPEELGKLTQLGYNDALNFLIRRGFIKRRLYQCLSTFSPIKVSSQRQIADIHCRRCKKGTKGSIQSTLPTLMLTRIAPSKEPVQLQSNKYFRIFSYAINLPLAIAIKFIKRFTELLESTPQHTIRSLIIVLQTLFSLDEILKKAIFKAFEFSHSDSQLCRFQEDIPMTDSKESLLYNKSSESLMVCPDCKSVVQQNIKDNRTNLLDEAKNVDNIFVKDSDDSFRTELLRRHSNRPGIEESKDECVDARGEADGQDCDAQMITENEYFALHSMKDIQTNPSPQMLWFYSAIDDSDNINYYTLAPIFESGNQN